MKNDNDVLLKLRRFVRSPGYFEVEWIEDAIEEIERLRNLMGEDMAYTSCPLCCSETANSNEVRINKMLHIAEKDAARWSYFRSLHTEDMGRITHSEMVAGRWKKRTPQELDAACDAAMKN